MSRNLSRAVSMVLGILSGAIVCCILSLWFGDSRLGGRILYSFGIYDLGRAFFVVFVLMPASTLFGAIAGGFIVRLLRRAYARDDDT